MTVRNSCTDYKYRRIPTAKSAGEVMVQKETYELTSAIASALAANDIIVMRKCVLPADHVVVDFNLQTTDLDTGASLDLDAYILNGDADDVEASGKLVDGSTNHQAAYRSDMNVQDNTKVFKRWHNATDTNKPEDRYIGIKINTAPATAVAGQIVTTLMYRAAEGEQGE